MTAFTDTSDPELLYSHCWQVKTRIFNLVKNQVLVFLGGSLILKLSFSTKDPPKKPIPDTYYFFGGSLVLKLSSSTKDPPKKPIPDMKM